jgi:hypothetical protein
LGAAVVGGVVVGGVVVGGAVVVTVVGGTVVVGAAVVVVVVVMATMVGWEIVVEAGNRGRVVVGVEDPGGATEVTESEVTESEVTGRDAESSGVAKASGTVGCESPPLIAIMGTAAMPRSIAKT